MTAYPIAGWPEAYARPHRPTDLLNDHLHCGRVNPAARQAAFDPDPRQRQK
ncbi:MAG TPA: hypothetical protein VK499_10965 [Propionibacteriaceae bacterium]|nr:hypothetical protein [Propionibacteriaceae bacterium]